MKLILTTVLFLSVTILNAQTFTVQESDSINVSEISSLVGDNIVFQYEETHVVFRNEWINIITPDYSELIRCDPKLFDCVKFVIDKNFNSHSEYLNQLELKVLFYEKHYGKIEGDMTEDCIIFTKAVNPPTLTDCKN